MAIIRREQPQVLVTYGDERTFYEHPDHVRVHHASVAAYAAAADPNRYPDAGPAWSVAKLYYSGFAFRRIRALHEAYEARGEASPYAERMAQVAELSVDLDGLRPTTLVDVSDFLDARRRALLAHRTQIDPTSHWMAVADEFLREVFPWEEYVLAQSSIELRPPPSADATEDDLFAGVREDVHDDVEVRGG